MSDTFFCVTVFQQNNIDTKVLFILRLVYLQQIQRLYIVKWIKNSDAQIGAKEVWREPNKEWENQNAW